MGMYEQIKEMWNNRSQDGLGEHLRLSAIRWRREPAVHRVEHPTRIERARALGYKSKQGYVVVRVRIRKGGARKPRARAGRRQKASGVVKYTRSMGLKNIAELRAKRNFPNLILLNSYYLWEDGRFHWYETIMRDPVTTA